MRYASCFAKEKTLEKCGEHDVIHADARVKSEPERRIPFLGRVAMDAKEREKKVPRIHKSKSYLLPRSFEFHPCCEKNALAASFPPDALNVSNSSVVHRSMFALFTAEMCTPSDRCTPEQSRHTNTQNVFDVHFGLGVLQSKHSLFPFLRKSALNSASRSFCVAILLLLCLLLLLELVSFSSFDVVYVCVCTRVFIMDDIDWRKRIGLFKKFKVFRFRVY